MDDAHHAMALRRQSNSAGAFDMNGAIGLCGGLGQNADEVDNRIRSRDCSADGDVVEHISLGELRCFGRFSRHLNTAEVARSHVEPTVPYDPVA